MVTGYQCVVAQVLGGYYGRVKCGGMIRERFDNPCCHAVSPPFGLSGLQKGLSSFHP
ncbi:hypothetical protein COMA2_30235 [Candidatus Nitrospira nitrificans]|uniref:Uncharacterized protein n=1 Tax=Candidatus Nitrospira nitrificans TaxID=1742973 RepID=A0A0S4LIG5_9BACT|nr:hypothetical protein COMA2_30235 [Candidatus Nitrospira nitrificans]